MPLSKAGGKGRKKRKEGPPKLGCVCVCGRTSQPCNVSPTYKENIRKLKHSGWWCHKWQALIGIMSIAHNSGSSCMSDEFMIPPPTPPNAALLFCSASEWVFFGSSEISPCNLASVLHTKNATDATLISKQRHWHNYSANISAPWGGNVNLDFSLLLHELFHFPQFSFRSNKTLRKKEVKWYRLNPWHTCTRGTSFSFSKQRVVVRTFLNLP